MKIRELRLSKNMTQKEFADMLNIGRTTVAMWESGAASPHTSKLPQIADALGCSIEDLFENSNQKNVI